MKPVKLSVVGAGHFAGFAHGPVLRALCEDGRVTAGGVADLDVERAAHFAREYGFGTGYGDFRRMLETERPDGVLVLTQVAATAAVGAEIMRLGYPVLLEKPPGRNRDEIDGLIAAVRESGCGAMVAFNRRYSPILRALREVVRETAEPVEHIRCDFYRRERLEADFSTTAIHGIDAVRHLAGGTYMEAEFRYQELDRESPARNIYCMSRFSNGIYSTTAFCPSSGAEMERFAMLTRHHAAIAETVIPGGGSDVPGRILLYRDAKMVREINFEPAHSPLDELKLAGYYGETGAFIDALRNGFPAFDDLTNSRDAVEIADAIRHGRSAWHTDEL